MELRKRKSNLKSETELPQLKKKPIPNDQNVNVNKKDWKIENFLLDSEWKSFLDDEFQKEYFVEMNKFLEKGYNKKIFLPNETLVFNAFNSTNINQVLYENKYKSLMSLSLIFAPLPLPVWR
jgi:hypothetical protein